MEFKTLNEVRYEYRDSMMGKNALHLGIYNAWDDWIDTCYAYQPNFNWRDFFDGCFIANVDTSRIVLAINRDAYQHLVDEQWIVDSLEQCLFIVFHIPLYVELIVLGGKNDDIPF